MSKGGRPRIEGLARYTNGRIKQQLAKEAQRAAMKAVPKDGGDPSPRVQQERQLFNATCFKGGGQGHHAGDAIGQLWLVGQLQVRGHDDSKLLVIAREWWAGRADVFRDVAPKIAQHERAPQGKGTTKTTKSERAYYRYEAQLRDADEFDARCLRDLMEVLDGQHCHWAARIIQDTVISKMVGAGFASLSTGNDQHLLRCAKRALIIMAGSEARATELAA